MCQYFVIWIGCFFEWDIKTARDMTDDYYKMCEKLNKDAIKEWCYKYRYKMKMLKEEYR